MKKCNMCGAILPDESAVCSSCGASLSVAQQNNTAPNMGNGFNATINSNYQQNNQNSIYGNNNLMNQNYANQYFNGQNGFPHNQSFNSLEEFFNVYASKRTKGWSKTLAIICIITAVFSVAALGRAVQVGYASPIVSLSTFLDLAFYITFAVLQFKKKNWVFPLVVTIYGGVFSILGLILSGTPSGLFAVIAGIIVTVYLKKVNDAYKLYKTTGQLPAAQI